MSNFQAFAACIAARFATMSGGEMFRVAILGDDLWNAYLTAFPAGTNPIYRVRTEHDGSYDRNFVRKLGNVVTISPEGGIETLWGCAGLESPYNAVCEHLDALVKAAAIESLFRINEEKVGYVSTIERLEAGGTKRWHHFHAGINAKHYTREVGAAVGDAATTVQVMRRGFEEISGEAVTTVVDLIQQNNLYRGAEFLTSVLRFQRDQREYLARKDDETGNTFLWSSLRSPAARLRNTVIGTLLDDLTETGDLEGAVKRYEQKVAPANYKRPTALITQAMVNQAMQTIGDLGLESSLERRFAKLSDISVNNVLWVDNQTAPQMKDGVAGLLASEVKRSVPKDSSVIAIHVDDFMRNVLPAATGIEVLFKNALQNNLVSLTAPVHPDVQPLFKWGNNFGWSYNGNITDSIKEKVKAAGGNIEAALRVSLAWFNYDDLDLHAVCPDGHVFYAQKGGDRSYRNDQVLDVDMNAGGRRESRTPVENLSWTNPKYGTYRIIVDQYVRVETENQGFVIEVANDGNVTQYSYPRNNNRNLDFIEFTVRNKVIVGDIRVLDKAIAGQGIAQQKWGLTTEQFVKVNTLLNSPNHWDGESTGNKHWFFILDQCQNDEPTRGIYNEFLKPGLEKHRKVFEVLGNKTKCLPSTDQLSGLGFSSTKRDSVIVKVSGSNTVKTYNVTF